jgi:hypothetical protein
LAAITIEQIVVGGTEPTFVAAAGGGDSFVNDGTKTMYLVDNASGGAITVTFDGVGVGPTSAVAFDDDVATSVGAGAQWHFGPFPKARFGSSVTVTYSGVTSLTVAAVKL